MPEAPALKPFAKYLWWKTPEEVTARPERLYAQVMDIGDYDDVRRLTALVGEGVLKGVLVNAEAGQFTPRSWAYWHYRLGIIKPTESVPAMPRRIFK